MLYWPWKVRSGTRERLDLIEDRKHNEESKAMQKVTPLRSAQPIVHINTFGAFLRYLREREQLSQKELVSTFPYFFQEEHDVPALTADMYRKLEKGKRAPQYEELLPLYAALVGNDFKVSPQERGTYVRLARLKIEGLQRRRPKLRPASEWRLLEIQLAQLGQDTRAAQDLGDGEQTKISKVRTQQKISLDTGHIVGREEWRTQMLSYLEPASKKLVVIQGMMGIGKTSGLKLLLQSLLEREEYWPILYAFSPATDITPNDHLDTFLATILAELEVPEPEPTKTPPLSKRIEQLLKRLGEVEQRVVLLLDDAQVILDRQGQLAQEWQQFLAEFLRYQHRSIIYLATREWPLWTGRERIFLVDGDEAIIPQLDPKDGAEIWRRLGFGDVAEDLLQQAAERCGGNALMIELRAASMQRPRYSFSWKRSTELISPQGKRNEHQQLVEQLLAESHVFGRSDVEARQLLQQVISGRITHDALQLLEVLSASPIAVPLPLLSEINQQAEYAFVELLKASLVDPNAMGLDGRVHLQPLAREAAVQKLLAEGRINEVEQLLIRIYNIWLEQGTFKSEQEQAILISELTIAYLRQHHLFEAAELFIEYGWLSFAFGHASRLARLADETMRSFNWHHSAESEAGGQLLHYYLLTRFLDKDLGAPERKRAYLHLYELMGVGQVAFKPRTLVHLVHHKLRYLTLEKKYAEAWSLIDEICERQGDLQYTKPITYAELLDRRAYILGRWGDFQDAQAKKEQNEELAATLREETFRLRQEAVTVHQQCIALLRQYERFASPIEQSHIRFKRARLLNDLAYYQRTTRQLEEAKQSMKECLKLKEAGFVVPGSLAVSYDDYGQLLGQLGSLQEALAYSNRALQIMQKLVDEGQSSAPREKGMFLVNRGKLLLLLGRLDEAKALLREGADLVKGTSRDDSAAAAEEGLRLIEGWHRENPRHQLDWRWFSSYHQLASYSDVGWLTQAGPFSEEEQREWDSLIQNQENAVTLKRMLTLVAQSRKRELAACLEEKREPHFHYPLIPRDDVLSRITELSQLRTEVEQHEPNAIVRRLYLEAIDERLDELHMIAATSKQDDQAFWTYNQRLNTLPSIQEMELALGQLARTLKRGLERSDTRDLAEYIIRQTMSWRIAPLSLEPFDRNSEQEGEEQPSSNEEQKLFSPGTVARFFADVFRNYQFSWTITHDPAADHARVSLSQRRLTLPEDKWMNVSKIRELLGHEIETHAFRAAAGEKSPLALLSIGLGGYLDAEEGLAISYTQEVARQGAPCKPNKTWIGTLATGLACGVVCDPFTFGGLLTLLESVNVLRGLLAGKGSTVAEVEEEARKNAQSRCLRTWRGVSQLGLPGICSTKDSVYLRGYLAITQALKEGKATFEQLMAGATGLHHLDDLKELGIVAPAIVHRRFATNPELASCIEPFTE